MTITQIVVTATFGAPDDTSPVLGQVTFQLSAAITDSATGEIVEPAPIVARIVDNALSVLLAANNNPTTVPPTTTYDVTEALVGATPRSYSVVVPYDAAAGTITLAALTAAP